MTDSNLVDLAQTEQLEALEQAWSAALGNPPEVGTSCETLRALCDRDMASRALPMASSMIEALTGASRDADAFELGMTLVKLEAHNESFARQLVGILDKRFAAESWYPLIREMARLDKTEMAAQALDAFEKMRQYTPGHVIYHRAGWGPGVVEDFLPDSKEVSLRFANGRTQTIPLSTALDSMSPLDAEDLRSMLLINRDELVRLMEEAPAILIRKAAKMYRGRVTSSEVKGLLSPELVPTKKWASFWKKAKTAAAVDPYLQVEGSTTRPIFELRKKPLSLAEEALRTLRHCDHLGEEVAQIRAYLERSNEADAQQTILDIAQEHIETAVREGKASHAHILDGILLLEKHERHPSTTAASELGAMLMGEEGDLKPENFDLLATQDAREHAIRLLPEALGDAWSEHCIAKLTRFPATIVEHVVGLLADKGHSPQLLTLWDHVAPYPQRHPVMTYLLGRLYADDAFKDQESAPERVSVARVLLHLARVLSSRRKADAALGRLLNRVSSLLTGRRNFLQGILDEMERDDMSVYLGISERGGADFPQEITDLILKTVARRYPELTAKPEKPFWEEENAIYSTRAGLAARQEDYRKLVEELIPANSKAIGAAASLGDLSENSEWDAAMEEQRNLTGRASMMDEDLRKAKLLEDIDLPENTVTPGTAVTYSIVETGAQETLKILGPWDCSSEDIINYRAPFAQSLLGKGPGDTASLMSDSGEQEIRIDSVERLL